MCCSLFVNEALAIRRPRWRDSRFFIQTRSIRPIMIFNRQIVRRGTLDGSLMALCGVTYTEFPDLAGLNSEITLVPIADLVPFFIAELMPVFV